MKPSTPVKSEELFALARTSLAAYAPLMFPAFQLAKHHSKLIRKLEAVEAGRIRRLLISMPPRHGKSLLTTTIFPSWYLGRNPGNSVITASYGQDLADDFGRQVRGYVNDAYTQSAFPELKIAEDSNSMKRFTTTAGGNYFAVGVGASITGRGANLLLIDDPIRNREDARSEVVLRTLQGWFSTVAYTRLAPGGAVVVIQTRWSHNDLIGWLLREHGDEGWDYLNMPAIAEVDGDGRKEGEALWPERFDLADLKSKRSILGGADFEALYQGRPTAEEGAVFQRAWWRQYIEIPNLKRIIQSWDTAFKTGSENDYSVCTTWGEAVDGFYLLHRFKKRIEFPELKRQVAALATEWKPNIILIEDKASGQSLIQEIKQSTRFPVRAIKVDTDKLSRAHAASPLVECGKVFLPKTAPWLEDYLSVMSTFPAGAHDDDVDSTTQALNFLRGSNPTYGLLDALQRLASGTAEEQGLGISKPQVVFGLKEPATDPTSLQCERCQSALIQKISQGLRCGNCGFQFGAPPLEVYESQRLPPARNAWRM